MDAFHEKLKAKWNTDQALIKSLVEDNVAFMEKAEKFDRYNLHLLSLEDVGVWGAINKLDAKLETVKTHLTKWKSGHSDWQMGRMSQWKAELDEILEG